MNVGVELQKTSVFVLLFTDDPSFKSVCLFAIYLHCYQMNPLEKHYQCFLLNVFIKNTLKSAAKMNSCVKVSS